MGFRAIERFRRAPADRRTESSVFPSPRSASPLSSLVRRRADRTVEKNQGKRRKREEKRRLLFRHGPRLRKSCRYNFLSTWTVAGETFRPQAFGMHPVRSTKGYGRPAALYAAGWNSLTFDGMPSVAEKTDGRMDGRMDGLEWRNKFVRDHA